MELSTPTALNIVNCVTIRLTTKNFLVWKPQMEAFLRYHDLYDFVDGSTSSPAEFISKQGEDDITSDLPNPEFLTWKKKDQMILTWLYGSLTEETMALVSRCGSSFDVWKP